MENSLDQSLQPGDKKSSLGMLLGGIMLAVVVLMGSALLYTSFYKKDMASKASRTQMQYEGSGGDPLDQDAAKIDTQLSEITNDGSSIDQGLNDQQIDLN